MGCPNMAVHKTEVRQTGIMGDHTILIGIRKEHTKEKELIEMKCLLKKSQNMIMVGKMNTTERIGDNG